jgi:DNA-binding IclR family transcriptional regulator
VNFCNAASITQIINAVAPCQRAALLLAGQGSGRKPSLVNAWRLWSSARITSHGNRPIVLDDDNEGITADRRQKVQSVEIGMGLLIALSQLGPAAPLTRLAQAAQMPPSKAHRYMRALIDSGLAAQDPASGLYRLGPEALSIGFAAIEGLDVVAVSAAPLAALRDRVNETCFLSVWANKGPAVVRIEPANRAIAVNVRLGSILPLLISAGGQVFSAFLDDHQVRDMLKAERRELKRQGKDDLIAWGEQSIARTRQVGLSAVKSTLTPGVSALAAPIFDHQNHIAGAFVVMGPTGHIDESFNGPIARELLAAAAATSGLLGRPKERQPG